MNIFSDEAFPQLVADLALIKEEISDEFQAFEGDEEPGIQYTLACNDDGSDYTRQTGDNSFTGPAYHYPHWGVAGVYRDSVLADVARDLISQLSELIPETDD